MKDLKRLSTTNKDFLCYLVRDSFAGAQDDKTTQ